MDGLGQSVFTLAASLSIFIFGTQVGPVLLHSRLMGGIARGVRVSSWKGERRHDVEEEKRKQTGNGFNVSHHRDADNGNPNEPHVRSISSPTRRAQPRHPPAVQLGVCTVFTGMWLATVLITYYEPKWRGIVGFSLIFSPPATWFRFYLSKLNPKHPKFPIGTFLANQIGTAILATSIALQYSGGRSLLSCQALQGIDDGFCGCLTTVSTFILEIRKLERKHSYMYVGISWLMGQALMLVILGSVDFSRGGLDATKCAIR